MASRLQIHREVAPERIASENLRELLSRLGIWTKELQFGMVWCFLSYLKILASLLFVAGSSGVACWFSICFEQRCSPVLRVWLLLTHMSRPPQIGELR